MGRCGQKAHQFEIYVNRRVVSQTQKLDFYIKPLSDEAAFNKGVEYFVEVTFFYGILIAIGIYEVAKSHESSRKVRKQIEMMEKVCQGNELTIQQLLEEIQK